MFRLIKLASYALLGYALYEFFRGLTDTHASEAQLSSSSGGGMGRASGRPREMSNPGMNAASNPPLTAGGGGQVEETKDAVGTSVRHRVGRGVVPS